LFDKTLEIKQILGYRK